MKHLNKLSLMLFVILALSAQTTRAEYASRKIRYASSYDVVNLLNKNFPGHGQDRKTAITIACDSVNTANRDVLGGSSVISGQPLMEKPNPGFIRWLNQCLTQYTKFEFSPTQTYRAGFAKAYLPVNLQTANLGEVMTRKWSGLAPEVRSDLVDRLAQRMIGPPIVYRTYAADKPWSEFTTSLDKTVAILLPSDATVATALATYAQTIFLRDEFLRY